MKSKKLLMIMAAVVLVLAVGIDLVAGRLLPTVNHGLRIAQLLQPILESQNQGMHMKISAQIDRKTIQLDSQVYRTTDEGTQYLVLEQQGNAVFISNNVLFLENGKAFALGASVAVRLDGYDQLLTQIGALYGLLDITAVQTDTQTTYTIAVTGEQLDALLDAISQELPKGSVQKGTLVLTEENDQLASIKVSAIGSVSGAQVALDVTLSDFRTEQYPIPAAVKQQAATVVPEELFSLTEDLYRLVVALAPLADQVPDGTVELAVNCGPLQLETQKRLSDLNNSSMTQVDPEMLRAMPAMLGWMCMEGDLRCAENADGYLYELVLDRAAMQDLVRRMIPEVASYVDFLTEGKVQIQLQSGALDSMEVSVTGKIPALITQIPVSIRIGFSFA